MMGPDKTALDRVAHSRATFNHIQEVIKRDDFQSWAVKRITEEPALLKIESPIITVQVYLRHLDHLQQQKASEDALERLRCRGISATPRGNKESSNAEGQGQDEGGQSSG